MGDYRILFAILIGVTATAWAGYLYGKTRNLLAVVLFAATMLSMTTIVLCSATDQSVATSEQWSDDYDFAVRYAGPPKYLDSYYVIQTDQDGRREATWRRLNEQP